jgi:hypothetical protein
MADEADRKKPFSGFRNPLIYTSVITVVALIYVGVTLLSRRQETRDLEEQAKAKQRQTQLQQDRQTVESLGGDRFDILSFYVLPGHIHRGDETHLCYGVSNAKSVQIDPPVGDLWPSSNRCLGIFPKKDSTYTLTTQDKTGNRKTATATVVVR